MSVAVFARERDLVYSVLLRWVQRRSQAAKWRGRPPPAARGAFGRVVGHGSVGGGDCPARRVTVQVAHDVPAAWLNGLLARGAC